MQEKGVGKATEVPQDREVLVPIPVASKKEVRFYKEPPVPIPVAKQQGEAKPTAVPRRWAKANCRIHLAQPRRGHYLFEQPQGVRGSGCEAG